jgi:ankyrin repeat protein
MSTALELIDAARNGDVAKVRQIVRVSPALADARAPNGESPLMSALYRGHREVVDLLVDTLGVVDVFAAAALGRLDDLKRGLADPAAVNKVAYDGWTPLHLAAFFGHGAAAKVLLDAGADVRAISQNSLHNTPLHAATAGGHADVALLLIDRGADVRMADAGQHTPLHIAAESGLVDVVKALLDRGADPLAVDGEDKTPLSRAAAKNHHAIIDLLNESGSE